MFNIDTLDEQATHVHDVVIGHRDGEMDPGTGKPKKIPVGFKVVGTASLEFRTVQRQIDVLNVQEAAARSKAGIEPGSEVDMSSEDEAAKAVDAGDKRRHMIAMACTVDWFGWTKGTTNEPAEFDKGTLERMLTSRRLWARRIVEAVEDDANFTKG